MLTNTALAVIQKWHHRMHYCMSIEIMIRSICSCLMQQGICLLAKECRDAANVLIAAWAPDPLEISQQKYYYNAPVQA